MSTSTDGTGLATFICDSCQFTEERQVKETDLTGTPGSPWIQAPRDISGSWPQLAGFTLPKLYGTFCSLYCAMSAMAAFVGHLHGLSRARSAPPPWVLPRPVDTGEANERQRLSSGVADPYT